MTSDQLVAEVRAQWGEDSGGPITDAVILGYMNKGQRILCLRSKILLTCWKTRTVAGQETYNLPDDYIKAEGVFIVAGNGIGKLNPMDAIDRDPNNAPGAPTHFYAWGEDMDGMNTPIVGLQPVPNVDAAVGVKNMEILGRQKPATMALAAPGPAVNPEVDILWQDALVDYALMCIYRRLGEDFESLFRVHLDIWKEWIQEAKDFINPLMFDYPIQRADTGNYEQDFGD